MEKLLIIEDHEDVNAMLREALTNAGYFVTSVYTGIDGLKELQHEAYDLLILDIMLPYKSGDELLRELRTTSDMPVIVISAKDLVSTKIDLLTIGADDYITKPFDLGEVVARVQSHLRRTSKQNRQTAVLEHKQLTLDERSKRVTVQQEELLLTAKEYLILELLLKNKGKVFTKANLFESIWQEEYIGDDNVIKTHISNLRNKLKGASLDEDYIETIRGLGYRLK